MLFLDELPEFPPNGLEVLRQPLEDKLVTISRVGDAVAAWERVRPFQPPAVDRKTGDLAHHLLAYRGALVSPEYLNKLVIPLLCRKAGVPREDARGRITSHPARPTIATQIFNAREPLSLFELQAWLDHRTPSSTQQYARITPTRLAKAYADAGSFARNLRTIAVLVDQDAATGGAGPSERRTPGRRPGSGRRTVAGAAWGPAVDARARIDPLQQHAFHRPRRPLSTPREHGPCARPGRPVQRRPSRGSAGQPG